MRFYWLNPVKLAKPAMVRAIEEERVDLKL